MKRIIILLIIICATLTSKAQLSGSGTYADPWSGSLEGDAIWSGTIYINGDIVVNNEHLTINAGSIIIFLAEGSDLIISGTGILEANGTSESLIRFTSDDDNDGIYGETGERWGHISFQDMTGSSNSLINNCIIEFGQKNSYTSEIESYGGGLYIDYSNLTVSNSIIRNNYAVWGGGILINTGKNPTFSNCIVKSNSSLNSGGGILIRQESFSSFNNCIIEKNICSGPKGGGGIYLDKLNGNVHFTNCVIASNINSLGIGNNISFRENDNSRITKFFNSIIWGTNNSLAYATLPISASNFNFCALQGGAESYVSCINISGTNNALDGPNFIDPDNSDYSIRFKSPCRDAGTTPTPSVPNDYIGNSRVGPYDIGAYEVQYSRWKTTASSTDWTTDSNWDGGIPTNTRDVVIPAGAANYPTGSVTQDFTLGTGKLMILEPGSRLTLDDLINNGLLKLNASSSEFASLIINSYTRGTGATEEIQLYLAGGGNADDDNFKWHYISTPVSSLAVSTFAPGTTLDVAQFIESRPSFSLMEGWVAYDGYKYSSGTMGGPEFSTLTPGKGYDFWDNANNTFTFSGTFNTSDVPMSLGYSGTPSLHGFNLLGNPFSSGLNWNDIINNVYFTYPSNTSKGVYFTRDNLQCTYIGDVGIPADVTGIIPPMQGFFTKTYSTGNTITIPAAARTNSDIHPQYKGNTIIPLVRLQLKKDSVTSDETVVRFNDLAKYDLDYDFDAVKMFISTTSTQIYSSLGGTNYAINGQPFPDTSVEIPIVINITKDTVHTLSTTQLDGLDDFNVTLKDNVTGFVADLKISPELTFSVTTGKITDRFILKISSITTGTEDPASSKNFFNIYHSNSLINIQTMGDEWDGKSGTIKVMDLTGKTVSDLHDADFTKNSIIQVPGSGSKGIYIVEMRSGMMRYVGKVVIR